MARRVHENNLLAKNLAIGISLASSMMLIRAGLEIWVINPSLTRPFILPIIVGSLVGFSYIGLLYVTSTREDIPQNIEFKNPFSLKEALIMGLVFGVTLALISLANRYIGNSGVYAVAAVSGISDVDAIVLSLIFGKKRIILYNSTLCHPYSDPFQYLCQNGTGFLFGNRTAVSVCRYLLCSVCWSVHHYSTHYLSILVYFILLQLL
jgi:uncharacterized membrane protein (DUF4010 family)